jgi:hypothetical protein
VVLEEIKLLEMLEPKSRAARGVDLDGTRDPERVGIVARSSRGLWRLR